MARPKKETFTLITFFDINNVAVGEFSSIADAITDARATLKAQNPDPCSFHLVAGTLIPLVINRDPTVELAPAIGSPTTRKGKQQPVKASDLPTGPRLNKDGSERKKRGPNKVKVVAVPPANGEHKEAAKTDGAQP